MLGLPSFVGYARFMLTVSRALPPSLCAQVRIECQTEPAESAIEAEDVEDESLGETYL